MILTGIVALLYPLVIQYKKGGLLSLLKGFALLVLLLDIVACYTEWWLVFGKPPKGVHTITAYINYLKTSDQEAKRKLAEGVQIFLDACEPDGKH